MNKKITAFLIFSVLSLFFNRQIKAQCPVINYTVPDSVCLNETFNIVNNSDVSLSFEWDFCNGEIDEPMSNDLVGNYSSLILPLGMTIAYDGTNWFAFIASRGTNSIFKLAFGSSLENVPTLTNLGNISSLLSNPTAIDVVKDGGNWYGLVVNGGNNKIVRIDFGGSLDNSPSATNILAAGIANGGIEIINDQGNFIVFITADTKMKVVNFGSTITNIPGVSDVSEIDLFDGASGLNGIGLIKECENWYGVFSSIFSSKIYLASFGTSLLNSPLVTDISTSFSSLSQPTQLTLMKEKQEFWLVVSTRKGHIHRTNLGSDLSNVNIIDEDLGDFGVLNNTQAFAYAKENSAHKFLAIDYSSKDIYKQKIDVSCPASIAISSDFAPTTVSFSQAGKYFIEATATDVSGSVTTKIDSIVVLPSPVADFNSTNACTASSTAFTDISESVGRDIVIWSWDFGDPSSGTANSSNEQNPTHSYLTSGDYSVTLNVTNSCSQVVGITKTVHIYNSNDLTTDFSFPSVICSNGEVLFNDESTFTDDIPVSWSWDFGGVGSSTVQNPGFIFASPGDYDVQLTVTGTSGCEKTIVHTVSVISGPNPSFTFSDDCVGQAIQFNNTSTGDIVTTEWDFGNGFTSNLENPLFQYASPGTYDVTLSLTNTAGCVSTKTLPVNVYELPDVQFTNDLACEGTPTAFADATTIGDANIQSWNWTFDDPNSAGNSSSDKDPSHIFTTSGAFDVKLVATSTNGCKDSLQQAVNVLPAPQAAFSFDKLCIGDTLQFMDMSQPVTGEDIVSWSWDLGGVFSSEQNPQAVFDFALDYNVGLTVKSQNLCTSTYYETLSVKPAPTVTFGVEEACDNTAAHFYDTTDPLGDAITGRTWNFADLSTGTDSSAFYAFNAPGTYNVDLNISTQNGCDYTGTQAVEIHDAPTAAFTPSISFGAPPLEVAFTNNSVNGTTYRWFFGDGDSSTQQSPVHVFVDENSYNVQLVTTDQNDCRDTTAQKINVLYPDLELELKQLFITPKSEETNQLVLMLKNNGTIVIDSVKVTIDLGNQVNTEETILKTIYPEEQVNEALNISLSNRNLEYICVTAEAIFDGAEDSAISNNTKCITFQKSTLFIDPYPNPGSDAVHVNIITQENSPAMVRLYNPKGDLVKEIEFASLPAGFNDIAVDVGDLAKGMYLIKASCGGEQKVFRIMIEN